MEEMVRKHIAVITERERVDASVLLYANEGERIQVYVCNDEAEADAYMRYFERLGELELFDMAVQETVKLSPSYVMKAKASDLVKKEYRAIEYKPPDRLGAEARYGGERNG